MPVRLSRHQRDALKSIAMRLIDGPTLQPRWNRILTHHRKVLRELVPQLLASQEQPTGQKIRKLSLLSKTESEQDWSVLRRVTKPISEEAMQAYLEERWPHIYKKELRTLLFGHGTAAYKKLVREAKISTPLI